MSDTILSGDFTVYYTNDTGGDKQIIWTGSATGTRTVRELYGALQDLFDDVTGGAGDQMDEGIPIRALTPTEYLFGEIEINDDEPWYIDHDTIQHLSGGSITTVGWTRDLPGDGTGDIGIVRFGYTVGAGTDFASSDIGKTVTHSVGGDSGTLLHFNTDGTNGTAWIRPDSNGLGDDWNSTGGNVSVSSGVGSNLSQDAAATTGENLYANIYTIGTIAADTQLYLYQAGTAITPWWGSGHIDILVEIQELGTLIDDGLLSIYARQYSKLYDHFVIDVSGGGRNPVPISTGKDLNNASGFRSITLTSATGTWNVGNYIYYDNAGTLTWSTTTKKGVITSGGTGSTPTLEYYLIGDLTDFTNTDEVTEYDPAAGTNGDANGDVNGAPTAVGPNTTPSNSLTIGFGGVSRNINNGNGSRPYSVELDLQDSITLSQLYQRLKYLTRRGQTSDIDTETSQTIIGESYTGIGDYYIPYDTGSVSTPFTQGGTISSTDQANFTATITSFDDRGSSTGFLILRDVRGTVPTDNENLTDDTSSATALVDENGGIDPVAAISPVKVSPFGTFAGGKFFGARGVWLANVPAAFANNYELIDSEGDQQVPPQTVALTVNNTVNGDKVSVFKTTGDNEIIDREQFTSHASNNSSGSNTFEVQEVIPDDTPSSGTLRVIDNSLNRETRYSYTSWSGSIFSGISPTLNRNYEGTDTAYVPYIDEVATSTSVSQSLTYVTDRYVLVRVRIVGMLPFKIAGQITTTGLSVTTIRTTDSVYQ